MQRKPLDQAAISDLEAATRAAEEKIAELTRLVAESRELTGTLKRDVQNPGQKNGSVSARAAYMMTQLQQSVPRAESSREKVNTEPVSVAPTRVEKMSSPRRFSDLPAQSMSDTRDLIRLQILAFVDYLNKDKKLKEDAKRDGDLTAKLKGAIDIVLDDPAFDEMMRLLALALSHSKVDFDCSERYKKLKDSVLRNCESYINTNRAREVPAFDQSIQQSIDKVTYALEKSQAIKEYLGKDKFSYLIHVMRCGVSENDIEDKLFMVGRMFPTINSHLADVARNNLELYREKELSTPESPPQKAVSSAPNLFQPPPRPNTPYPVRKTQSDGPSEAQAKTRPQGPPPPPPSTPNNKRK